jgi:hypothetical protein
MVAEPRQVGMVNLRLGMPKAKRWLAMDEYLLLRAVWFVAKCATLCLRLVVRIKELTLGTKVRQSVAS